MHHVLKILPEYFNLVKSGVKTFELRYNDRKFKIGDIIELVTFLDEHTEPSKLHVKITYVLQNCPQYGLKEGFAILGIKIISM